MSRLAWNYSGEGHLALALAGCCRQPEEVRWAAVGLELAVPARRCGLRARRRGRTPQSLQGRSRKNHHLSPLFLSPDAPLRPKVPGKQRAVEQVGAHAGQPPGAEPRWRRSQGKKLVTTDTGTSWRIQRICLVPLPWNPERWLLYINDILVLNNLNSYHIKPVV